MTLQGKELVRRDSHHLSLQGKNSCLHWRIMLLSNQWAWLAMRTSMMEKNSSYLSKDAPEWEQVKTTSCGWRWLLPISEHTELTWLARAAGSQKGISSSHLLLGGVGCGYVPCGVMELFNYCLQEGLKSLRKTASQRKPSVCPDATEYCLFFFLKRFLRYSWLLTGKVLLWVYYAFAVMTGIIWNVKYLCQQATSWLRNPSESPFELLPFSLNKVFFKQCVAYKLRMRLWKWVLKPTLEYFNKLPKWLSIHHKHCPLD